MRSNYKLLGDYIQEVNVRNTDLKDLDLLGISIQKEFIPSIANTIGTDMSKYKIVKKNQFAYGTVTSRNGDKISIALLQSHDESLISQAYISFEVIDENELLPEYLMMWFRRPEFDRYARYRSYGSAREVFSWEEMCNVKLPVPSIENQREIVKEYGTVLNRIDLNINRIKEIESLGENIYSNLIKKLKLENSNSDLLKEGDGDISLETLNEEIPKDWSIVSIKDILKDKGYIRGPFGSSLKKDDMVLEGIPVYEQQHIIGNHRDFRYFISKEKFDSLKRFCVEDGDIIISCSGTLGKIALLDSEDQKGIINQALLILRVDSQKISKTYFKYFLKSEEGQNKLIENAGGSAQVNIAKREEIENITFIVPNKEILNNISEMLNICDKNIKLLEKENRILLHLKNILCSQMTKLDGDEGKINEI